MTQIPLNWFVCPVTKKQLEYRDGFLYSSLGHYARDSKYGYWNFVPQGGVNLNTPEWHTWKQLQENGVISYQADPESNLGVGKRKDFLKFAEFCKFHGNVLDIGVGPQRSPTHIKYCTAKDVFFVGIDPLVGDQPRTFAYVQGLAEYLPFRDELFDQVLFVTSLDHLIDPRVALREAKRVLNASGDMCIWIGEKNKNAPKPTRTNEWYDQLVIPKGAEDRFHFKRFTSKDFESYVLDAGLHLMDKEATPVDQWRNNLFYRIGK